MDEMASATSKVVTRCEQFRPADPDGPARQRPRTGPQSAASGQRPGRFAGEAWLAAVLALVAVALVAVALVLLTVMRLARRLLNRRRLAGEKPPFVQDKRP
jgi:hypothetical protein